MSLELLERWQSADFQAELAAVGKRAHGAAKISLLRADATRVDWSDADLLFANSTCFDERLMTTLATLAERMKPGAFCVTFTKVLPSGLWRVLEAETHDMTWGKATIFIQRKEFGPGPAQFVGTTPIATSQDDFSPCAKLLVTNGAGYTSDVVALDFSARAREGWWRTPGGAVAPAPAAGK